MTSGSVLHRESGKWIRVFVNRANDGKESSYEFFCLIYVSPGTKQKGEKGSVEERLRAMTGGKIICKPLGGREWKDRTPPLP